MEFDIEKFEGGAFEGKRSPKEFEYSEVMACGAAPAVVDWDAGYDSEEDLGFKLKHENQGGSGSCVAQTASKVGEGINFVETGQLEDFSARRIYSNIFLSGGGAFTEEAAKWAVNKGFIYEKTVPSYFPDGSSPTEDFMREKVPLTELELAIEKVFASKLYFWCRNIDEVASAILNYKFVIMSATGENPGWKTGDLIPPVNEKWGHAFVGKAFKRKNNPNTNTIMKAIKIHNSWSESWGYNGDGWLYENYFEAGQVHFSLALIDKENLKTMGTNIKLVKTANNTAVYLTGIGDEKFHPILTGKIALDLFGKSWEEMNIEIVESIPEEKIGYLIGGIVS